MKRKTSDKTLINIICDDDDVRYIDYKVYKGSLRGRATFMAELLAKAKRNDMKNGVYKKNQDTNLVD